MWSINMREVYGLKWDDVIFPMLGDRQDALFLVFCVLLILRRYPWTEQEKFYYLYV